MLLPRADRRRVLVVLLAAGILSNIAVAIAPNFGVLLAGRLVIGVAIAAAPSSTINHKEGGETASVSPAASGACLKVAISHCSEATADSGGAIVIRLPA